jgi:hypothetical protein
MDVITFHGNDLVWLETSSPFYDLIMGKLQIPPELSPIYTKPPDTKKTLIYPPPNLSFSLTYDPFGGKLSKLPFAPKLRRFGLAQNDVILPKTV